MSLFALACGSESNGVASIEAAGGTQDAGEVATVDVETAWIAFAQCLRENGLEVKDPVVNSKGLVQKPELVEGAEVSKKESGEAYKVCGELIAGVTVEKDKVDQTEYVDRLVELARCLRGQGIDVDDPDVTAEKLGLDLGTKLKKDWDSPAMQKARDACDVEAAFGGVK